MTERRSDLCCWNLYHSSFWRGLGVPGYFHILFKLHCSYWNNLTVALSLERLGPRAKGLVITSCPGPSSLCVVLAPRSAWPNFGVLPPPALSPGLGLLRLMLLPMLKSGADWYMRASFTRLVLTYLQRKPDWKDGFHLGALSYFAVHKRCSPDWRSDAAKLLRVD